MHASSGGKVVVVDDDSSILRLLSRALETAGYSVRQSLDGADALRQIEDDCPDFVITDLDMPRLGGLDLCRRLRMVSLPHYVYVIILTGKSSGGASIAGLEAGADDFLTKPISRDELLARLHAGRRVLELERRLLELAQNDPLTDIPARRAFREHLDREFARANRYALPLACVMLDVDFFKHVNDEHGHAAGDQVLKGVANLLADSRRSSDFVCRYGGEEFCAILPETTESQAFCWGERLRGAIAELSVSVAGESLRVTASLGVAQLRDGMAAADDLVDHADQALLVAKQSGRNRVVCHSALSDEGRFRAVLADDDPFRGVVARDVMTSPVVCLHRDETIEHSADFFCRYRLTSAPVVDDSGKLVGVVSEKDVIGFLRAPGAWRRPIAEVMRPNVVCYEEETPVDRIHEFLCRVAIRRVIIVKHGWPTGVVSRGNLLRWFSNWQRSNSAEADRAASPATNEAAMALVRELAAGLARAADELRDSLAVDSARAAHVAIAGASRVQERADDMLAAMRGLAARDHAATLGDAADEIAQAPHGPPTI